MLCRASLPICGVFEFQVGTEKVIDFSENMASSEKYCRSFATACGARPLLKTLNLLLIRSDIEPCFSLLSTRAPIILLMRSFTFSFVVFVFSNFRIFEYSKTNKLLLICFSTKFCLCSEYSIYIVIMNST